MPSPGLGKVPQLPESDLSNSTSSEGLTSLGSLFCMPHLSGVGVESWEPGPALPSPFSQPRKEGRVRDRNRAAHEPVKGRGLKAWASTLLPHPGHLWGTAWTHQHGASLGIEIASSTLGRGPVLAPISLDVGVPKSLEGTLIWRSKGLHPFSSESPPKCHSSKIQEKRVS